MTTLGSRRDKYVPELAELRSAISLVKSRREPDGSIGFNQSITPYANIFARVLPHKAQFTGDEPDGEGTTSSHAFSIRSNTLWRPAKDDYVVHKGGYYRILDVMDIDERSFFLNLYCLYVGKVTDRVVDDTTTPENPNATVNPLPENSPIDGDFPFWKG